MESQGISFCGANGGADHIYICIYIYIHIHIYIHICIYIYICIYICIYIHIYIYIHIHIQIPYIIYHISYTYTSTHTYTYVYVYAYTYMFFKSVGAAQSRAERLEWNPKFAQNPWAKACVRTTKLGAVQYVATVNVEA